MLSVLILYKHSYPAMPLVGQLVHQRFAPSGPLVLGGDPLKIYTPVADRDRTVSRRSEPSSRAVLMGEQPNPWKLLHLQDKPSRPCYSIITYGTDYTLSPWATWRVISNFADLISPSELESGNQSLGGQSA